MSFSTWKVNILTAEPWSLSRFSSIRLVPASHTITLPPPSTLVFRSREPNRFPRGFTHGIKFGLDERSRLQKGLLRRTRVDCEDTFQRDREEERGGDSIVQGRGRVSLLPADALSSRSFLLPPLSSKFSLITFHHPGCDHSSVPDSFLPTSTPSDQSRLIPSPNLYPTPPPGSILTPLSPSPSATPPPLISTRKPRAPRPAGKLGSTLPLISPSGSTSTIGFGSLKIDSLDQIFSVTPPPPPTVKEGGVGEALDEREEGEGEDGKWFAKGFMNEWVEFRLEEEEISKGGR